MDRTFTMGFKDLMEYACIKKDMKKFINSYIEDELLGEELKAPIKEIRRKLLELLLVEPCSYEFQVIPEGLDSLEEFCDWLQEGA